MIIKKILHIQVLPKLSGAQKVSLEILKSLPADYDKYILFSDTSNCSDKTDCQEQFEKTGAKVLFMKELKREISLSDITACIKIYRLCRKEKFDIVHTNSTKPGIIGRIAATLARVSLIVHTVHGLAFHRFLKFPKWQFYWLCEMFASMFCDKIILVNQYYMKYFKWFRKKTCVLYNGMDYSLLPVYPIPHFDVKVLFVGRLDSQKDPISILKAAQIVCKRRPDTTFTLVGDGEKRAECERFIATHNLEKNICLTGWQKEVAPYYLTHDLFVSSSIYEAFGLVFLEAGYYKLPVVATRVEGIPEVIKDNLTGLLCEPGDYGELAKKILYLIEHEDLRKKLGENAHEYVTHTFTLEKMRTGYLHIYENRAIHSHSFFGSGKF